MTENLNYSKLSVSLTKELNKEIKKIMEYILLHQQQFLKILKF
jgi:hypothetical protein